MWEPFVTFEQWTWLKLLKPLNSDWCRRHAGVSVAPVGVAWKMPSYSCTTKFQRWWAEQSLGPTFPAHSHTGCHGICRRKVGPTWSTSSSCSTKLVSQSPAASAGGAGGSRTHIDGEAHHPLGAQDAKDTTGAPWNWKSHRSDNRWPRWPLSFPCAFCSSIPCIGKGTTFGEVSLQYRAADGPLDFS